MSIGSLIQKLPSFRNAKESKDSSTATATAQSSELLNPGTELAYEKSLLSEMSLLLADVEGWCTPNKASILHKLASKPDVKLGLEIGVFGGKSFFPVCAAFKKKKSGLHYGIEPWSNQVAVETKTSEANDDWWSKVDLDLIKRLFFKQLIEKDLVQQAAIVQAASDSAFRMFESNRFHKQIDLLHIDGSHACEEAIHDVVAWGKLVRQGGYIVLDDINWESVHLAYDYLRFIGEEIYSVDQPELGHFAVVRLK